MPESTLPPKDSPVAGVRHIHATLREEIAKRRALHPQHPISMTPESLSEDMQQTFRVAAGDRWFQIELEWFEKARFDPAMGGPPYRGVGSIGTSWGEGWKVILWDSLKKEYQWGYYEGSEVRAITSDFLKSLVAALPGP
ncbi:MAG: hypothetical protein ACREKF_10210 [Candidatus Methylomirabilales bacterium]